MATKVKIPEKMVDALDEASKKLDAKSAKKAKPSDGSMTIVYSKKGPESPIASALPTAKGMQAYSGDYWGTFSLENFASASSLSNTHEDAWGWLQYLENFNPRNFRYLDGNVRIWAYYEDYDNWQDTYGMDAVMAVYHSGHGGMSGDGRFHVPLGADWAGLGTTAWSDRMRLGNEQVRYIFWSTCLSCRVLDGHTPIRTWGPANLGFRMLFGYETVSYDYPNYGSAFWNQWNKGKSFSTAFLDASWYDVTRHQAPAVVACGATEAEAKDRLFNERYFSWAPVSRDWWWWRWYSAALSATAARARYTVMPDALLIAELEPQVVDDNYVKSVLARHDMRMQLPSAVQAGPEGIFTIRDGDAQVAFESDGAYELQLAQPNRENTDQISAQNAVRIAEDFVGQHGLDEQNMIFDQVMLAYEAGGQEANGQIEGPFVTETTVHFTQEINGVPVLQPGKGGISVTVDNDGVVTSVKNATRRIGRLTSQLKNSPAAPGEEPPTKDVSDPEMLLNAAWQQQMAEWLVKGQIPLSYEIVPNTYEIGYVFRGNEANLVARHDVEVDAGNGYRKRYTVEVPLAE